MMTVNELFARWLRAKALELSPTTLSLYKGHVRVHLGPALGDLDITQITEEHGLAFVAEKREQYHRNTVSRQLSILKQACRYAVAHGHLEKNPLESIRLSIRLEPAATVLDEEQARAFLTAARASRYCPLYVTALFAGLRRGELMGLRWQDVDWKAGTLLIWQTIVQAPGNGTWITKEPKSRTSRRRIAVPPVVLDALRALHDRRSSLQDRVFTNPDGSPWSVRYIVRKDLPRVCARARVPVLRLHDLRHTYASLRLAWRHSPRSVQEALGHSTVAFTLAVYAHVLPGDGPAAAEELQSKLVP